MNNTNMTRNMHTHLWYCKHADGEAHNFCLRAVELGITILGISDHTPLPDNRWPDERMTMDQLPLYNQQVDQAKLDFPKLQLFKGLECECIADYHPFYQDILLGEYECDYLIGSIHYVNDNGTWIDLFTDRLDARTMRLYAKTFITAIESGLYTFIAHPDIFGCALLQWDRTTEACVRDMLIAASHANMPLEINTKGFRKPLIATPEGERYCYPWPPFWELVAEYQVPVLINTDAHRPSELTAMYEAGRALSRRYQLTELSDTGLLLRMHHAPAQRAASE